MEGIQPTTCDWCKISEPSKSTPLEIPVLKPQNEGSGQITFLFKPGGFQVPGVNFPGCMMLDWIIVVSGAWKRARRKKVVEVSKIMLS